MNSGNSETSHKGWIEQACQFVTEYWGLLAGLLLLLVILLGYFIRKKESSIKKFGERFLESLKTYPWSYSLAVFIGFLVVVRLLYQSIPLDYFLTTMKFAVEVTIAVVALVFFYRRLRNQDKQVAHQIRKETDDRFTTAVNLLGSAETSARTGAIYSLYQLFIDEGGEKYRRQIAQILCSHIRTKTQEPEYKKNYKNRPSNEIQTAIDLLFKEEKGNIGIYCMSEIIEQGNIPIANLERAYLRGADFKEVHCEKADFEHAHCEGADFGRAHCEGADFGQAYCTGANFVSARCEGGNFWRAHCEGAYFREAHCEVVDFGKAYCQGANFGLAHCEGAIFRNAHCEGAYFYRAYCQGANFGNTDFRGSCTSDFPHYRASKRLRERVGKETELENVIFAGPLSEEAIQAIHRVGPHYGQIFYDQLKEIIKENEGMEKHSYKLPENVKKGLGKLEGSPELRQIIQKLEEIEKNNSYL